VKNLSSRWAVAILLAPVLLILGLAFLGGSNPASAKAPPSGKALVGVAFVSTLSSDNVTAFQRIFLNVSAVRLNASTNLSISDFGSGWVTIPVPSGVGKNSGVATVSTGNTFGGSTSSSTNSVLIGTASNQVQIDLNAIQGVAQIFNVAGVPAKTYNQVELVLNSGMPGNAVPVCPGPQPAGEGCISYKAVISPTPSPQTALTIRAAINGGLDLSKGQNFVTPLVINIDPGISAFPTSFNAPVLIDPSISVVANDQSAPPFTNALLATVQGTVTITNTSFSNKGPQAITALLSGTNNIVISQALPNSCNGQKTCTFTMYLPAAQPIADNTNPAFPGGTNYDFVFSQKNATYGVISNFNVFAPPGSSPIFNLPALAVAQKTTPSFTGKIVDYCTGIPVQAATVNLLLPDPKSPMAPANCAPATGKPFPPPGCVVVASASTDEVGNFPLPGSSKSPPPFMYVPNLGSSTPYEMIVTAAGFDRTPVTVTGAPGGSGFKCTPPTPAGKGCTVGLSHGIMSGNLVLGGGDTGPAAVMVAAEDNGTNNIENLTLVTVGSGNSTATYTMNVPDVNNIGASGLTIGSLDLFASTQDLFNGAPQKNTGHTFAVTANVGAPPAPNPGPPPACVTVNPPDLGSMTCVGHGSGTGTVTLADQGTNDTVVLSKGGVQIQSVPTVPFGANNAGRYAICAPADTYTFTHYVQPNPSPVATPTAVASVTVTLTGPTVIPTSTPSPGTTPVACPTICQTGQSPPNGCQICQGTTVVGP
jgi:hypothetical protein